MIKILNLKLLIIKECQNENFSQEIFVIKKTKNTFPWTYVINDLKVKKLL